METRSLTANRAAGRLDRYLAEALPDLSRARLQRLIADGHVVVDGAVVRAAVKIAPGQQIIVTIPDPAPTTVEPQSIPLTIVHEDRDLIVVDKPAGLSMHPGPGHPDGTLVNALVALIPDLQGIGGERRPGIVHRLDRDTSGLVIVAKNQAAHVALTAALAERRVKKRYLALVAGIGLPVEGRVEGPIGRDPSHRQRMTVRQGGREAVTGFRLLAEGVDASLVEARPETGRTHQIRVHFASIHHALIGDRLYGGPAAARQMLHAWRLGFAHPATGEWIEVEAAIPEDFREAARELGLAAGLTGSG